jgi:hypothetical protein
LEGSIIEGGDAEARFEDGVVEMQEGLSDSEDTPQDGP